eukprot:3767373-Rhodomonas_salina.1
MERARVVDVGQAEGVRGALLSALGRVYCHSSRFRCWCKGDRLRLPRQSDVIFPVLVCNHEQASEDLRLRLLQLLQVRPTPASILANLLPGLAVVPAFRCITVSPGQASKLRFSRSPIRDRNLQHPRTSASKLSPLMSFRSFSDTAGHIIITCDPGCGGHCAHPHTGHCGFVNSNIGGIVRACMPPITVKGLCTLRASKNPSTVRLIYSKSLLKHSLNL